MGRRRERQPLMRGAWCGLWRSGGWLGLVDVADKDRGEAVLALLAAARRLVRLRHAGLDPGPARLRAAARGKRPRCRREPRRWLRRWRSSFRVWSRAACLAFEE